MRNLMSRIASALSNAMTRFMDGLAHRVAGVLEWGWDMVVTTPGRIFSAFGNSGRGGSPGGTPAMQPMVRPPSDVPSFSAPDAAEKPKNVWTESTTLPASRIATMLCRSARLMLEGGEMLPIAAQHPEVVNYLKGLRKMQLESLAEGHGGAHLELIKKHILGHEQLGSLPPFNKPANAVSAAVEPVTEPRKMTLEERIAAHREAKQAVSEAYQPAMSM